MTEYPIKYLLKHTEEFGTCNSCTIINLKTNERCWVCKMPTRKFNEMTEEYIAPLRKFSKKLMFTV